MPRYGEINTEYISSWFNRPEPGGPMWALNLMKYREQAEYADGRVGRFWVEDRFLGDHRTFAEARFDLISPAVADQLAERDFIAHDNSYAVIADPRIDEVARSLTEPTKVLL